MKRLFIVNEKGKCKLQRFQSNRNRVKKVNKEVDKLSKLSKLGFI